MEFLDIPNRNNFKTIMPSHAHLEECGWVLEVAAWRYLEIQPVNYPGRRTATFGRFCQITKSNIPWKNQISCLTREIMLLQKLLQNHYIDSTT